MQRALQSALILLGLLSASCAGLPPAGDAVSIRFALEAAGRPVACGDTIGGLGAPAAEARLTDARFYVHDVALIDERGGRVPLVLDRTPSQFAGVALVDFGAAAQDCAHGVAASDVTGRVPPGRYTGLAFTIGVPVTGIDADGRERSLNHSAYGAVPSPLDIVAMGWNWQAGRKFMKIEVDPLGGVRKPDGRTLPTWPVHLGSTGCKGNPVDGQTVSCDNPNRIPVVLAAFDPRSDRVVLDLGALFAGSDLTRDAGGAAGCMSGPTDPECAAVFGQLGLRLKESVPGAGDAGRLIENGGASRIFRAAHAGR
jgi:uncharacterized repeat protein (TIGR04052 family)